MSGTVLVVTSGKGGVGKSTTALNLGVALGVDGHSVALVDADLGMANLGDMLGVESDPTLHDVLAGEADVESAVVAESEAFGIVPGGRDLARYAEADPGRLPAVLATLAEEYEYVVVDAGAGLGYADVTPIDAADAVILVTTPDDTAVGDAAKMAEFSGLVDTRLRGVVVTRASEGVDAEAIAAAVGTELLGVVPEDPAVPGSTDAGVPLEQYAPDSPAAAAYRQLAATVSGTSAADSGDTRGAAGDTGEAAGDDAGESAGSDADGTRETTGDGTDAPSGNGEPSGADGPSGEDEGQTGDDEPVGAEEPDGGADSGEGAKPAVADADDTSDPGGSGDSTEDDAAAENGGGGFLSRLRGLF